MPPLLRLCLTINNSSPIMTLFRRPRQNSYLLRAFEFGYKDFGYIITRL